jgi:hypothetical protein
MGEVDGDETVAFAGLCEGEVLSGRCESYGQSEIEKKVLHGGHPLKRISSIESDRSDMARTVVHHAMSQLDEIPGSMARRGNPYLLRRARYIRYVALGDLIDQFLRDQTNKRTDRYGGSIEHRCRFLMEVVEAVAAAVGDERTGVWISPQNMQNDITDRSADTVQLGGRTVSGKSLAYLHIIERDTSGLPVPPFDYKNLKRLFGGLVITNNGFDKARANEAIAGGRADLVAFGKPFIANRDLVIRLFLDAPLIPLNRETLYGGAEQGYIDYLILRGVAPHACYEHELERAWG